MKLTFFIIVLLILAATQWWPSGYEAPVTTENITTDDVQSFMRGVRISQLDGQGVVLTLEAERLEQHDSSDSSRLIAPRITLHHDQEEWTIAAATGSLDNTDQTLSLNDDVIVKRTGSEAIEIRTSHLEFDLNSRNAATEDEVHILSSSLDIRSTGMRFDTRANRLDLVSRVRGIHVD